MTKIVLIVEDTESIADSLALAFEDIPGIKPVVLHHPKAALRFLKGAGGGLAAIITDLNLPEMDGIGLIEEIRRIGSYENVPAILITADESATLNTGHKLGSPNAIFRKPFSMKEVRRVLESFL